MAELLKDVELEKKGARGVRVKGGDVLKGKMVALYFSAHWCGPCRQFTPVLKSFYEELTNLGEPFEVVFISADRSLDEMYSYVEAHGSWYHLPTVGETKWNDKYKVEGIPCLVVIRPDGSVICADGSDDMAVWDDKGRVKLHPAKEVYAKWKAAQ